MTYKEAIENLRRVSKMTGMKLYFKDEGGNFNNKIFNVVFYDDITGSVNELTIVPDGLDEISFVTMVKFLNDHKVRERVIEYSRYPHIKNVIFNYPATIVLWSDGTKTVVKSLEGEDFDPEKGLAMAISKKSLGNNGRYYEEFKKWLAKEKLSDTNGD